MKRFLGRGIVLLCLCAVLIQLAAWGAFQTGWAMRTLTGREVYEALAEARRPSPAKVILLGDSVATQLYTHHGRPRDDIRVLCSNAAISMAGQYVVLLQALEAGSLKNSEVVLVYHPDSFRFDIQDRFAFQYFVKPFYRIRWLSEFSPTVKARVREVPWSATVWLPMIRFGNWTPDWKGPAQSSSQGAKRYLREVSIEYLHRIEELSRTGGFPLRLMPPPVCEMWANEFLDVAQFQSEVHSAGLDELFRDYFDQLQLRPRNWYRDNDMIHLRGSKLDMLGNDPLGLLSSDQRMEKVRK